MNDNINRGKQFEQIVKSTFETVKGVSVDRIHDQTTGFSGSSNICDLQLYKYPYIMYIECKTTHNSTLNFSNIRPNQWNGLLEKAKIPGVIAGVLVWFIKFDKTYFVPIKEIEKHRQSEAKSINVHKVQDWNGVVELKGYKKRVFFNYNGKQFLDYLWTQQESEQCEF